jgi:hypothetical protein
MPVLNNINENNDYILNVFSGFIFQITIVRKYLFYIFV